MRRLDSSRATTATAVPAIQDIDIELEPPSCQRISCEIHTFSNKKIVVLRQRGVSTYISGPIRNNKKASTFDKQEEDNTDCRNAFIGNI